MVEYIIEFPKKLGARCVVLLLRAGVLTTVLRVLLTFEDELHELAAKDQLLKLIAIITSYSWSAAVLRELAHLFVSHAKLEKLVQMMDESANPTHRDTCDAWILFSETVMSYLPLWYRYLDTPSTRWVCDNTSVSLFYTGLHAVL